MRKKKAKSYPVMGPRTAAGRGLSGNDEGRKGPSGDVCFHLRPRPLSSIGSVAPLWHQGPSKPHSFGEETRMNRSGIVNIFFVGDFKTYLGVFAASIVYAIGFGLLVGVDWETILGALKYVPFSISGGSAVGYLLRTKFQQKKELFDKYPGPRYFREETINRFETRARDLLLLPLLRWHRAAWNRRATIGQDPGRCLVLLHWLLVERGP